MVTVFFLYHFNDIDHISPVMWKCLERGHRVEAVLLNPDYPHEQDPRLQLLAVYPTFRLRTITDILGFPGFRRPFYPGRNDKEEGFKKLIREAGRRSGGSIRQARKFLREVEANVCVFEWGSTRSRNRTEFFRAATTMGLPRIAMPHGMNIFTNSDPTPELRGTQQLGTQIRASLNQYDAYVFQTALHRDMDAGLGLDVRVARVVGSARYCLEWHNVNVDLYPEFLPERLNGKRLRVVFMLPHWHYNVDQAATLQLAEQIGSMAGIALALKEHTRGSGAIPEPVRSRLSQQQGVEIVEEASSVSLVKWADVVLCFGSSIGLEALNQGKILVNPSFLHGNTTIFDDDPSCITTQDLAATVEQVSMLRDQGASNMQRLDPEPLRRRVVHAEGDPDVLARYVDLVEGLRRGPVAAPSTAVKYSRPGTRI